MATSFGGRPDPGKTAELFSLQQPGVWGRQPHAGALAAAGA
ncbi:hypothetical protein CTATCC11996_21723 [Comamonas testosteroni ATCC 11996]|nr:hypothetical protein CTATCC11996_21723 [Comamonas testosteroni ATCC 11996]